MDGLANKVEELFKNNCRTFINQLRVLESKVFLGPFKCNDVQSVFTFNSQIFKVQTKDVKKFIKEIDKTVQLVVKVFDPVKAKRDHNNHVVKKQDMFENCRKAY